MTHPSVQSVRKFIRDWGNDGWSILTADCLIQEYGFPAQWVSTLVYNHKSGEGKYAISDNTGKPVKSMKGVHTLSVLSRSAGQFGTTTPEYFGRGRQAGAYSEAIMKVIGFE